MAVHLAHLDLGADLRVLDGHPAEGDVLSQDRRPDPAGDRADLLTVDHDRVAGADQVVADQVQAHQDALRVLLGPDQGIATDEVVLLGLEWNREADAGLEGVRLVAELGAGEDQSGLHAQHVQGL